MSGKALKPTSKVGLISDAVLFAQMVHPTAMRISNAGLLEWEASHVCSPEEIHCLHDVFVKFRWGRSLLLQCAGFLGVIFELNHVPLREGLTQKNVELISISDEETTSHKRSR